MSRFQDTLSSWDGEGPRNRQTESAPLGTNSSCARVNVHRFPTQKTDERLVIGLREFYRQAGGRGDGRDDGQASGQRLLRHLERNAPAQEQDAFA